MDEFERFVATHGLGPEAAAALRGLLERRVAYDASTLWTLGPGEAPEGDADAPAPPRAEPRTLAGRYLDLGLIGSGGMGEVRRVRDLHLERTLAMKIVRSDRVGQRALVGRFMEEAHATAQLQHPGIVPVHDLGQLPDGRPWFTMREVHGEPLRDVIRQVHRAPGDAPDSGWSLRRLLSAVVSVCNTVAYAHRRGVVHRDLKPSNIMLGDLGEVYVLDWGIAKVLHDLADEEPDSDRPSTARPATRLGRVAGTPAFMAPEQARGGPAASDPAVDVYALGALLYVVLSGSRPFEGDGDAILEQLRAGPPEPVTTRARRPPPPELVAICERAMARRPEDRHPSAEAVAGEVQDWLVGARRREQALEVLGRVEARQAQAAAEKARAARLRAQSEEALRDLPTWAPEADKAAGWAAADQAEEAERAARLEELAIDQTLQAALQIAPDLPEAHVALVERHRALHAAAEDAGDDDARAVAEIRVRTHADALPQDHPVRRAAATYLRGDGALTLHTDPPGAEVLLHRFETRNRRLVETFVRSLGTTPLDRVPLPRGSYLCVLRHPDHDEVRYPVEITRLGHWDGVRPGDSAPTPVRLPPRGMLGPDEIYVPAGWFCHGGDPLVDCLPRGRAWCDALVVQRVPATVAELVAFLNHLLDEGDEARALSIAPKELAGPDDTEAPIWLARGEDGRFDASLPARGGWQPDWPVALLDWDGARAYLAWLGQRTGRPWRLPSELEWEKAARGVDGRWFPWGNHHDWSWANMRLSSPGQPSSAPVTSFPEDRSVYGIRGFGGSTLDWCMDPFVLPVTHVPDIVPEPLPVPARFRVVRGGSAKGRPRNARVAYRYRNEAWRRHPDLGVRGFYRPW